MCVQRVSVLQAAAGKGAQGLSSTQAGAQISLHIGPTNILHSDPPTPIEIILKLCEQKAHIGTTNILHFSPVNKCSQCFDLVLTPLAGVGGQSQLFTPSFYTHAKVRDVLFALHKLFTPMAIQRPCALCKYTSQHNALNKNVLLQTFMSCLRSRNRTVDPAKYCYNSTINPNS